MALRSVLSAGLRVARARVCTGEPALRASTARTARLSSVASRSLHSGSVSDAGAADGSGEAPAHHNPKGGFRNPWPSYHDHGLGDIVRMLGDWDRLVRPKRLAVQPPDFEALANPPETGVQATWIGHATFVVQMDGFSFITDPVFSHRASAVSFVGPARYTPVPCAIADLPPLDFALISHNHYDHLDRESVRQLVDHGVETFFAPLGVAPLLKKFGARNVVELDWWQQDDIDCGAGDQGVAARVTLTPAQHHTGRTLADRYKTLWGGFAVHGPRHAYYFSGDTGYRTVPKGVARGSAEEEKYPKCPIFEEIGERLGPFDLASLPIGAYEPRWFMSSVHAAPHEAVAMHREVRAKRSVGMHWGTFFLTCEPVDSPPVELATALEAADVPAEEFVVMTAGETRVFNALEATADEDRGILVDEVTEARPAAAVGVDKEDAEAGELSATHTGQHSTVAGSAATAAAAAAAAVARTGDATAADAAPAVAAP